MAEIFSGCVTAKSDYEIFQRLLGIEVVTSEDLPENEVILADIARTKELATYTEKYGLSLCNMMGEYANKIAKIAYEEETRKYLAKLKLAAERKEPIIDENFKNIFSTDSPWSSNSTFNREGAIEVISNMKKFGSSLK